MIREEVYDIRTLETVFFENAKNLDCNDDVLSTQTQQRVESKQIESYFLLLILSRSNEKIASQSYEGRRQSGRVEVTKFCQFDTSIVLRFRLMTPTVNGIVLQRPLTGVWISYKFGQLQSN